MTGRLEPPRVATLDVCEVLDRLAVRRYEAMNRRLQQVRQETVPVGRIDGDEMDIGNEGCAVVQFRDRCAQVRPPVATLSMKPEGPDSCYRRVTMKMRRISLVSTLAGAEIPAGAGFCANVGLGMIGAAARAGRDVKRHVFEMRTPRFGWPPLDAF